MGIFPLCNTEVIIYGGVDKYGANSNIFEISSVSNKATNIGTKEIGILEGINQVVVGYSNTTWFAQTANARVTYNKFTRSIDINNL